MADYDDNKQAHQLTVVNGTIDEDSLIICQDSTANPLGVVNPKNIVGVASIDDIQDGSTSKKVSAIEKGTYDDHLIDTDNPHSVDKIDVGLGNVDNTTDANKPVSTAQQSAINAHADLTNNPHSVTQTQVGLSNVDNTTDANKPVSTAQQTALDGKEDADATIIKQADVDDVPVNGATTVPISSNRMYDHENDDTNPHSVTKTQVGLSNVDNTTDANKPISTAQDAGLVSQDSETGAADLPTGTVAERPTGAAGLFRFNSDDSTFEGHDGVEWGPIGGGGGGLAWVGVAINTIAVASSGYMVDSTGGPITITLPLSPTEGDTVGILDVNGNFVDDNVTVDRNSENIMGLAEDMTLSSINRAIEFTYSDATNGWRISAMTPSGTDVEAVPVPDPTSQTVGDALVVNSSADGWEFAPVVNKYRKNLLINGDGQISQRGIADTDPIVSGDFIRDRFRVSISGVSGVTAYQDNAITAEGFRLFGSRCTSFTDSGANFIYPISQRVEGYNVEHLIQGANVTLSFKAISSIAGIHTIRIILRNTAGSTRIMIKEFTIAQADVAEAFEVPLVIPAGYIGKEQTLEGIQINFGTFTGPDKEGTPDAWSTDTSLASTANAVDWPNTGTKRFGVGLVQLEVGEEATDFEYRTYGEELALCHRYYWRGSTTAAAGYLPTGPTAGTARHAGGLVFPVFMRVAPSIAEITTPSYSNCSTAAAISATIRGATMRVTTTGGSTTYYRISGGVWSADAEI